MAGITGWWAEFFASIQARHSGITATMTALQHNEASIVAELDYVVAALLGVEHPKGSFEATLIPVASALTGSPLQQGEFGGSFTPPGASLAGVHFQLGNIAAVMQVINGALSSLQYQRGSFAALAVAPTASLTGFLLPQGHLTGLIQNPRATLSAQHIQRGNLTATLPNPAASMSGTHKQSGTLASQLHKALAFASAAHIQRGSFAVPGKKPTAVMNGEFVGVTPVVIDQVGTPGSENTGNPSCSISPASGADVVAFAWVTGAASSCYQAVYGGSSLPMRCLGRVKFNGGTLTAFAIDNVSSGSATVTISKTGSDWGQAVALSYTGSDDFRQVKVAKGSGTTSSQSASPGSNALSIQSFTRTGISGNFTSPSGGTGRVNETAGFVCGTVRDADISATFSAGLSSSANWGGVVVDATPSVISAPKINHVGGVWSEVTAGSRSFTVKAAANDYIVVDVVQDSGSNPSSITCDGSAMTLIDTQTFTTGAGTGFLKRYHSAQQGSGGDKTVAITNGGGWCHIGGVSISNVTSFGTPAKGSGTSSTPSQSATCSAGQLILQSFATVATATDLNCANFFDSPGGSQIFLYMNSAEETTTFSISNSTNWASMATVIT